MKRIREEKEVTEHVANDFKQQKLMLWGSHQEEMNL